MAMIRPETEMKNSGIEWIGDIPTNWRRSKLKYLGEYINGYAFKPSDWSSKGHQIIRIQDLTGSNSGEPNYFDGILDEKYRVVNGDILVSWAATLDAFVWKKEDGWLNQHIFKAVPNEKIVNGYFLWLLKVAMDNMNNDDKHGIVMQHVTIGLFNNYVVPLAPYTEQQAIADYLDKTCSKIDEIIAEAKASIDEYKKLKQSAIFEAVTKGLDKNVEMKDSTIEFISSIPLNWKVCRIATIYEESKETGREDLPILMVSINTGISEYEVGDDQRIRKVTRSDDKSIYKVVHRNDLVYNMMRAWQGGFGAAQVDGLVSPAYVVATPKSDVDSRYIEALLRTPIFTEKIHGLSYGVADFRLRLYWTYFKELRICLPPIDEQREIANYIANESKKIDRLIKEKTVLINDLEAYKKSLIYEVVTGKRRVV